MSAYQFDRMQQVRYVLSSCDYMDDRPASMYDKLVGFEQVFGFGCLPILTSWFIALEAVAPITELPVIKRFVV